MANELSITALLSFAKSPAPTVSGGQTAIRQFNVTGAKFSHGVVNIGTTAEALPLGDVGTAGWFFVKNLDSTNYVELLSATDGSVFGKLKAGELMIGRFGCAAPAAQANTAPCNVEYLIVED